MKDGLCNVEWCWSGGTLEEVIQQTKKQGGQLSQAVSCCCDVGLKGL